LSRAQNFLSIRFRQWPFPKGPLHRLFRLALIAGPGIAAPWLPGRPPGAGAMRAEPYWNAGASGVLLWIYGEKIFRQSLGGRRRGAGGGRWPFPPFRRFRALRSFPPFCACGRGGRGGQGGAGQRASQCAFQCAF
jgi:hypothetical protein